MYKLAFICSFAQGTGSVIYGIQTIYTTHKLANLANVSNKPPATKANAWMSLVVFFPPISQVDIWNV